MARRRGVLASLVQLQREAERDRQRRTRVAQRDRQRADAADSRQGLRDDKERQRRYVEDRTQEAADDTAQLEREVHALQTVLAATLDVDDFLDLEKLKNAPPVAAFNPGTLGSGPTPPRREDFDPGASSKFGRMVGAARRSEHAQQGQREYEQAVQAHRTESERHADRLAALQRQQDAEAARVVAQHRQDVGALQRGLAAGEPDAVVGYLDLVLEAAAYPDGFPHQWRLEYRPGAGQLVITYELPPLDVVPSTKAHKYVKSSDTTSATARPATQLRALYADVVRQTALRVVHEVLEADRGGKVRTVVFNGHVSGDDPATGRSVRPCLVAYATSRERFLAVDLGRVEPSACLTHLEARVSKDPSRLVGVDPIVLAGTLDEGYVSNIEQTAPASVQDRVRTPPAQRSGPRRDLRPGENVPLSGTRVEVDLRSAAADLSVLLLGVGGRVDRDEDFVFYNNPRSVDGAVELRGGDSPDSVMLDLTRLGDRYERLVLVASAGDGASSVARAELVVRGSDGGDELAFRSADLAHVSALVCGEVYRRAGQWRLRAVGQGWADGLAGLARDYGVDVS